MNLIDSHCHIDGEAFDSDRREVIANAISNGVLRMLNIGTGGSKSSSFENTLHLAQEHNAVYGAVGVHPHNASEYDLAFEERLISILNKSEKMIAWGEIGLDFFYDHSPRARQVEVFRRQIQVAQEQGLPIIVHSREADSETLQVIRQECSGSDFHGGIMHCFAGTPAIASELIKIGFLISFAGNVTFKKADNLRESALAVPLEKMLVETDCPYLTPVPYRGKRNEPARVADTARFIAELKEIELADLAKQTTANFEQFFGLA